VLLVKRPEDGLLGGMLQPPLGPWTEEFPSTTAALAQAPFAADWRKRGGIVRLGFTHFELEIEVYVAEPARDFAKEEHPPPISSGAAHRKKSASSSRGKAGMWVPQSALAAAALPTVMRKIIAHALDGDGPMFAQLSAARRR
jgi:A/G-specific adenine glycosylase